jgi:amino-acid N-acetyltransferase
MVRKARQLDVRFIHGLLSQYGEKGLLLARPLTDIYEFLRDFVVAQDEEGKSLGCCALHLCWENLCEVRSLAVLPEATGKGWGTQLAEACLAEAMTLGFHQVFALTYRPSFFKRLGFTQVDKKLLPNKVWADCVKCVKFPDCDEIAMLLEL